MCRDLSPRKTETRASEKKLDRIVFKLKLLSQNRISRAISLQYGISGKAETVTVPRLERLGTGLSFSSRQVIFASNSSSDSNGINDRCVYFCLAKGQ